MAVPGAVLSPWPQGEGPRAGQDHLSLKTQVETEGHTQTGQFWVNTSLMHVEKDWSKWEKSVHAINKKLTFSIVCHDCMVTLNCNVSTHGLDLETGGVVFSLCSKWLRE